MYNKVTFSEIRNRQIALGESSVEREYSYSSDCKRKYDLAKRTNSFSDIRSFITEVSNLKIPDEFIDECLDILKENKNPELYTIFKKKILSRLDNYTLENYRNNQDIAETNILEDIKWQLTANKVVDRILENDNRIQESYPLNEFFKKNSNHGYMFLIEKCCNVITDNFKLPINGIANITLEECTYLLQKNGIAYNEEDMIKYVISHCINLESGEENHPTNPELRNKIYNVIQTNYCIDNNCKFEPKPLERFSEILSSSYNTMQMPYKIGFTTMKDVSIKAPAWDIKKNIFYFFSYIENILVSDKLGDASSMILDVELPKLYNELYEARIEDLEARDIFIAFKKACELQIAKNNKYITNFDNGYVVDRFLAYSKILKDIREKIDEALSYIYPKYAIECMRTSKSLNEADDSISLESFKDNQFRNIINKCRRIDQILEHKISINNTINDDIRKITETKFDQLTPYDLLEQDGTIDFCIEQFQIINKDHSKDLHDFFTESCKEINTAMLNHAVDNCYYTMSEDHVNLYIKESKFIVSLTENDRKQIAMSEANNEINTLIDNIALLQMVDENFNLMESAQELFMENPDIELFNTFLEGCKIAGIDRGEIVELCDTIQIKNSAEDHISFGYYAESAVINYIPATYINYSLQLEAYALLQALVEDSLIKKRESKSMTSKDNSNTKDKVKDKVDNKAVKPEENKKEEEPKQEEKKSFNPFKGLKLADIKLALKGLGKFIKDAGAKVKSGIKEIDFTISRLIKGIKGFFVSDNREKLIKGSIIPSFHKCILIAVGEAALWVVNPILSVISLIGGFAISKKLTEKERALLLDDIEIELEVVEKELQMAESHNKLKKMRALMKIKKDLQRQYQRIRYNIRIGKDIIPSKTGTPGQDED